MKTLVGTAIVTGLLSASSALAQFPGDVPNNFRLRVGGIFANLESTASLSTGDSAAEDIDLGGVLGQPDTKNVFRGDGYWNFLGRFSLDFGFLDISSDASRSISRDIHFGGVTYTAGADVDSENESRYIYGAFRYDFVKNPSFHLGMSLGVSYTTLRTELSAEAGVVGPGGAITGRVTRETKIDAPVPLLGLEAEGRIAGTVSIGGWVRAFDISIDPYSGSMVEAMGHVDWYFARNFGIGGGYEYSKIDVKRETDTKTTEFDFRYDGPRLYFIVTF